MSIRRAVAIGAFLVGSACQGAQADVTLFYNLDQSIGAVPPISGPGPLAQSFWAGGAGLGLTGVMLNIETNGTPIDGGSFIVTLNADTGGFGPGDVLASLGTFNDTALGSSGSVAGPTLLSLAGVGMLGNGFLLTDNRYWIELSQDPANVTPTVVSWDGASGADGVGVAAEYNYIGGSQTAVADSFPFGMSVEAPEPVSIALLGVGLAGLGWARSRRKSPAARV